MFKGTRKKMRAIALAIRTDRPVRLSAYICLMLSLTIVSQMGVKFFDLLMADITIQLARQEISFTGTVSPVSGISDYDPSKPLPRGGDYATAYMGNYVHWKGDTRIASTENGGSHIGVDIYTKINDPIYAIANGVVTKVDKKESGFGYHIVVLHPDFPSPSSLNEKQDYYSSYSHLNEILVREGDIVEKGQKIALAGNTGTSTAPHLHFQMDKGNSPYKPWWPFTYAEAQAEGLDFFSAVNSGLGQEKGRDYTIHPMLYVQRWRDYSGVELAVANIASSPTETSVAAETFSLKDAAEPEVEVVSEEAVEDLTPPAQEEEPEKLVATSFEMAATPLNPSVGETVSLEIRAVADNGDIVTDYRQRVRFGANGAGEFTKRISSSFDMGVLRGQFTPIDTGSIILDVSAGSLVGTAEITVSPSVEDLKAAAEPEVKAAVATNKDTVGDSSVEESLFRFSDVPESHEYFDAISYVKEQGIVNGYEDGTFKPERVVARVEALKMIIGAVDLPINEKLKDGDFPDVESGAWYIPYIAVARDMGAVRGYSDGTFKPQKDVLKAEALKIMMSLMEIDPPSYSGSPFNDVEANTWIADYVGYAKEQSWVEADARGNFDPLVGLTRGGMADIIYRLQQ